MNQKPASPCIGVCILDSNNICEGCYRTVQEIAGWSQLNGLEQTDVIRLSWQRAKKAGKVL